MRRIAAKFVPKLLNFDQKQHGINIAKELLDSVRNDSNLLQRVIIDDKSWIYGYDVNQSSIIPMEAAALAKTEKSAPSSFECEGFAYNFLRLQGRGGAL